MSDDCVHMEAFFRSLEGLTAEAPENSEGDDGAGGRPAVCFSQHYTF